MNLLLSTFRFVSISCCLFLLLNSLCSFSALPVAAPVEVAPPVEKTVNSKRQTRLNKQYNRLHQRFEKTTNSRQRLRLQYKIRQVERQQEKAGTPVWGVLGLGFGIISFIIIWGGGILFSPFLFVLGFLAAVAGLVFSIYSLKLHSQDPKRYTLKGLGVAGIIVSSIFMLVSLLIFIGFASSW